MKNKNIKIILITLGLLVALFSIIIVYFIISLGKVSSDLSKLSQSITDNVTALNDKWNNSEQNDRLNTFSSLCNQNISKSDLINLIGAESYKNLNIQIGEVFGKCESLDFNSIQKLESQNPLITKYSIRAIQKDKTSRVIVLEYITEKIDGGVFTTRLYNLYYI